MADFVEFLGILGPGGREETVRMLDIVAGRLGAMAEVNLGMYDVMQRGV